MFEDDPNEESFEETVRSIVREVSRSIERVTQGDFDDVADALGVDLVRAKEVAESAVAWLRAHAEGRGMDGPLAPSGPRAPEGKSDPAPSGGPHPLDLPTAEQGQALAALDSGRWTVGPGSDAPAAADAGPSSREAAGLVDELRARDWISAQGEITQVGRHALSRWLDAAA